MRRYHFIIPALMPPDAARAHGNLPALVECRVADPSSCVQPIQGQLLLAPHLASAAAASPYVAPASVFDSHSHLLHGLLHVNGFGHLLRINGREGGSKTLTGVFAGLHAVMDCPSVGAHRVSKEGGRPEHVQLWQVAASWPSGTPCATYCAHARSVWRTCQTRCVLKHACAHSMAPCHLIA